MYLRQLRALFCKLSICKILYFSPTEIFILEDTKFTRKELLWIFLIANDASVGIFGLSLIIFNAKSLIESIVALNFLSSFSGFNSINSLTEANIKGSSEIKFLILKRFFPWIIIVKLPSGICRTLNILATVPILFMSDWVGFETLPSFWETTPINLSPEFAFLINLTDLSLVAVIGITTPGNKTVFLNGRIGRVSGILSLEIASSSSDVIKGINSDSSSIGSREIELKSKILLIGCQYVS